MPVATTTEAGRQVITPEARDIIENATQRRARLQAASKSAAEALTPSDAPAKPIRPTNLADAAPWLLRPFAQRDIELKPSATNREKTKGLASPYADMRCYFARLDKICGVENWSHTITLSERGAVCALTIFGVTKSAAGDYPPTGDVNSATSAEAQAFKRTCAAFGLGRYLYSMGDVWAELDSSGKRFVDPQRVVAQMYASLPRGEE